jgi:sterol desaturase/sphingolipid hydroxylase (fatty acid hydroxylase superfamily)
MRSMSRSALPFPLAIAFALLVRPGAAVGLVLAAVLFVPLERRFPLVRQRVFRRGLLTDLAHLLVDATLVAIATVLLVGVVALPLLWIRAFDLAAALPSVVAVPLALVIAFVGNYWAHRLTHRVPFLWRFHAVHHSIEEMDWLASGRLHPIDAGFTQAFTALPLFVLGYDAGAFAGVAVLFVALALFQHANVRLRFPIVRWVVNTPEWHHWHHATDADARDTNFGLPVVDRLFGTAYLPRGRRPTGFGVDDPVPPDGWLRHLAYPFTGVARASAVT